MNLVTPRKLSESRRLHLTDICSLCVKHKLTYTVTYLAKSCALETSLCYSFHCNLSLKTMVDVVKLENSDGDSAQVHLHGKLTEYE